MTTPHRTRPFILSATVDFPDDVEHAPWSHRLLDALMAYLRELGVRRVNWLYYGDTDPASPLCTPIYQRVANGPETIARIGEPVRAAVPAAHRHGIELYAVLKPYHGGTTITWPEGSPDAAFGGLARIGGRIRDPATYLVRQPDLRIARRPAADDEHSSTAEPASISRIRLVKADDGPTRIDRDHLEIWTSPANYRYGRADTDYELAESVEPAEHVVVDYFGRILTRAGSPRRVLTLSGLTLREPFVLVTTSFDGGQPDFTNTASAMVEVEGAHGARLPIVVATRSATATSTRDFRVDGLEFDCGYGPFPIALDAATRSRNVIWSEPQGGCVAFAVGKNAFLPTAPCEAEPVVQKVWLAWIDRLVEAGVDGVDIRISGHGTLTDEPTAYGFNRVLIDAFRLRHGSDLTGAAGDLAASAIAEIRGASYTGFLRRARTTLRAAGVPLEVHLHTEAFRPDPPHGALMGFPANIRFAWRDWLVQGLVDAATLRLTWYEALGPPNEADLASLLADPFVGETIEQAQRAGVPVNLNRYAMAGGVIHEGDRQRRYLDDIEFAYQDPRLAGFDLYETSVLVKPGADGASIEEIGDFAEGIRRQVRRLGI